MAQGKAGSPCPSTARRRQQQDLNELVAQQVRNLRSVTRKAVVNLIEEHLALGLDSIDVEATLLLGRCCRHSQDGPAPPVDASTGLGDAREAEWWEQVAGCRDDMPVFGSVWTSRSGIPEPPRPLPRSLRNSQGGAVEPQVHEYARLEGYRWATGATHGRGTVFRIDRFGERGESLLCPAFCEVVEPDFPVFLEGSQSPDAEGVTHRPVTWLRKALGELCVRVRNSQKLRLDGIQCAIAEYPSLVLTMPAGKAVVRDPPTPATFGRKAARRHNYYIDGVEMGARLRFSVVPPAITPSGDLDDVDRQILKDEFGAELFALAHERGRLCVRQDGGPPLDPNRMAGASLDDVCKYLTRGWAHSLSATPTTWRLLFVSTAPVAELEASIGPPPGRGIFAPLDAAATPPQCCGFCGAEPTVGVEAAECHVRAARAAGEPLRGAAGLCAMCSTFVQGSPAFIQKQNLVQLISRPIGQVVGSTDEGLDEALQEGLSPSSPVRPKLALDLRRTQGPDEDGRVWGSSAVPSGAAVMAASGLISLAAPPQGWDDDRARMNDLAHEICVLLGCERQAVHVTGVQPEVGALGLVVGVVLLHPAVVGMIGAASSANARADRCAPLHLYRRLVAHLQGVAGSSRSTSRPPRTALRVCSPSPPTSSSSSRRPLFRANDPARTALPCSLIFFTPPADDDSGDGAHTLGCHFTAPTGTLQDAIQLDTIIRKAKRRLTEKAPKKGKGADVKAETRRQAVVDSVSELAVEPTSPAAAVAGPVADVFSHFAPSSPQLALRLREVASAGSAVRCEQLLTRWGKSREGSAAAALAVVSRAPTSFKGRSALDMAVATSNRALVECLLSYVPEVPEPEPGAEVSTSNAVEICELLNAANPVSGQTPLYAAALYPGDSTLHMVERLLRRKADINATCHTGTKSETALVAAVRRTDRRLVSALLRLRADANARTADSKPLLQLSVEQGEVSVLEVLLAIPGCEVDAVDPRGRTALMTALRGGYAEVARILVEAGCDVEACDNSGAAPILHAIMVHDAGLCELLLGRKADKDAVDPADGTHILHLAVQARNDPLLYALLSARSDIHATHPSDGRTLLHLAAGRRMPSLVRMLLEFRAKADAKSIVGDTPLRVAVQGSDAESAELLCQAHGDPNCANRSGCAPIHAAVANGSAHLAKLLVQFEADVHLADSRRWRPIHYGASAASSEIMGWLLERRANVHARSYHGRTPRQLGGMSGMTSTPCSATASATAASEDRSKASQSSATLQGSPQRSITGDAWSLPMSPSSMILESSLAESSLQSVAAASGLPPLFRHGKIRTGLRTTPRHGKMR